MKGKKRFFSKKFHQQWDQKVIAISNGLTILEANKGHWKSPDGKLFSERMIPVRISCTEEQIHKIMDITANHYKQLAILAYRISNQVFLKNYV